MDDDTIDRIYAGCVEKLPAITPRIVRIFTSSTFTDMSLERNTLMEEIYPKLKAYCRDRHGLEFQVVDMRWGVRDEATDDHMTTELCMNEIKNCQRLSLGPNFVENKLRYGDYLFNLVTDHSKDIVCPVCPRIPDRPWLSAKNLLILPRGRHVIGMCEKQREIVSRVFLGQKYGYRPIPTFIDGVEFAEIKNILIQIGADVTLLDRWYKEDTNAIPSVYVLQPISSILANFNNKRVPRLQSRDQGMWWDTLGRMQCLLRRASQVLYATGKMDAETMHSYRMSVTEREVINGLLTVPDPQTRCLAYIRRIDKINMDNIKAACKFVDIMNKEIDKEADNLLSDLRDNRLPSKIRRPNLLKWTVDWYGRDGLDKEFHEKYLHEFTSHFYKYIVRLVDKAAIGARLDSLSPVVTEILQHLHACNSSVTAFEGRVLEMSCAKAYIEGDSDQPMILFGTGGCGKTSLLAKIASLVSSWYQSEQVPFVVMRLLGITPTSSCMMSTLQSLCQQIAYNYSTHCNDIPHEYIPLVGYFKRLLTYASAHNPLCILIDSTDQLSGYNLANKVSWIPTSLPKHVKMIVSTLVDDGDNKDFLVLGKMIESEIQFVEIKALGNDLGMRVVKNWMSKISRDLSKPQWKIVRNALSHCNLPIFTKLVFAEISRWKSYLKLEDTVLSHTVMDSIMRLFQRIETQHGQMLVSRALSYITASKNGLSEMELEDLISIDDQVLEDVYQYHLPPIRRIPPLLWTRIRNDLPKYLSEREADSITVLNWYHRQFRRAAEQRYFKNGNIVQYLHSQLADYFLGTWGGGVPKPFRYTDIQRLRFGISDKHGLADRKVPLQPMIFASVKARKPRYNLRKFGELPYHLVRSKRYNDLFQNVLFNYLWLYNKLSCCPLSSVLADFADAQRIIKEVYKKEIALVADSIRLGGVILCQYPSMIASQILGRLIPLKERFSHIKLLLEQCDKQSPQHCALLPAYHCLHTPGGAMKYLLEGHPFAVFGLAITSDFRYIISVSNRLLMWDLGTGDLTQNIDPDINGIMENVVVSFDDKYAVSYNTYNLILTFNVLTGDITKYQLDCNEPNDIRGISVCGNMTVVWRKHDWMVYTTANIKAMSRNIVDNNLFLVAVYLISIYEYYLVLSNCDKEGSDLTFRYVVKNKIGCQIKFKGSYTISKDFLKMYVCELTVDCLKLVCYTKKNDSFSLVHVIDNDIGKDILDLSLNGAEDHIIAVLDYQYLIWNFAKDNFRKECKLPNGVRNISIRPTTSQSHMVLTKGNEFGVAGVRKVIYIWKLENEELIKIIEAHCARILNIVAVIDDFANLVISSSLDHTIKVWNIDNIFEETYSVDRMEMPIDSISLSRKNYLAATVTRNSIGIWNIRTGKLICKLADSPLGAIITHGTITSDGRHIACIESDNLLIWEIEKRNILWKKEYRDVCQLLLHDDDTKVMLVTRVNASKCICRNIKLIDGIVVFSIQFVSSLIEPIIITYNNEYLIASWTDIHEKALLVYSPRIGIELNKITVEEESNTDFQQLMAFPGNGKKVIIFGRERGQVFNVVNGNHLMTFTKWSGYCSNNGKYGLYTPSGGGLDIIELKHCSTTRVLLPRSTEGMFEIQAGFTKSDDYVYYYHGGRKTLSLFRMSDGKLIADYHLSADTKSVVCTFDNAFICIGGFDGSLITLIIVDPENSDSQQVLEELPSRKI